MATLFLPVSVWLIYVLLIVKDKVILGLPDDDDDDVI